LLGSRALFQKRKLVRRRGRTAPIQDGDREDEISTVIDVIAEVATTQGGRST